jgi:hypothetical protein
MTSGLQPCGTTSFSRPWTDYRLRLGVVMMVTMMAVVLHDHHDLSPRRIRQCKAEKEN